MTDLLTSSIAQSWFVKGSGIPYSKGYVAGKLLRIFDIFSIIVAASYAGGLRGLPSAYADVFRCAFRFRSYIPPDGHVLVDGDTETYWNIPGFCTKTEMPAP